MSNDTSYAFLKGGGEMGALTRNYDWLNHRLGDPAGWPPSLKISLGILLNSRFPMFLWWGREHYCFYNDAYLPSLGSNGKHPAILGMPASDAWPEIWDYIKPLMDQILGGGDSVFNADMLVPIYRNGRLEEVYWTFGYSPVTDESGHPSGVLVTCMETTAKVAMVNDLKLSEQRFQNLIMEASVGIIVLSANGLKVEIVNKAYCRLIDRSVGELIGKPIFQIIPEAEPHFRPIIEKVIETNEPVYLNSHPYFVYKDEKMIRGYLNIIYQPYRLSEGNIAGVMILCHDVTEQIDSGKQIETALEQARLSKEAAQMGTFDMDLEKGVMQWDKRCRTLFGISHDEEVSYEHDFVKGLHPEDRSRITGVIDELFTNPEKKGNYDVEYRTIGVDDGRERWVRAKGKVYFDNPQKPVRFIGSVLEITEQKLDEQRKNDFIGMVSHELKTPLTSVTAMVQLLIKQLKPDDSLFTLNVLAKANQQLKKMATMIRGFLDMSRLEAGKMQIHKVNFDLKVLLEEAVEETKVTLPNYRIQFDPCNSTLVYADRDKIGSVISNLVSNAAKYSPDNADIVLKCETLDEEIVVSVKDHGIGIYKTDIDKLFDRYYRVEDKSTYHIAGFGIGLYLSAEIIRSHSGKIWAESEFGKGSTFFFTLPRQLGS
jgi:two-component system sensor histidine kinase VicK